jgi:peptidoglycan/LPS O-acetylase OafA/YrhL
MSEIRRDDAPRFFVSLESLRGLAALVVVVFHAGWTNPVTALRFFQNGALMVDFFFVLSGFVIFHSYGRKLGAWRDIARFLWLRVGRLYPLHLAFLLVFLAFEVAKFVAEKQLGIVADKPAFTVNNGYSLLTNVLLIQSLGLHHSLTYNYPSWSISVEFYAYVLFAAVRWLWGEDRRFDVVSILIVVISTSTLLWVDVVPLTQAGFDWGFFRCCGGFFLGVLAYRSYSSVRSKRAADGTGRWNSWLSVLALVATIVFLSSVDPRSRWTYLLPLLAALVILSIVLWPRSALQRLLSSGPLAWLGRVSYSLYMVHAAVVWMVTQVLTLVLKFPKIKLADGSDVATPPLVGVAVLAGYVVIVLVLSHFTYDNIEAPFRRRSRDMAERWFPAEARRLVIDTAVTNS